MECGEEEPRDDDDVSKLGENAEPVFESQRTDDVAHLETKLGDHDGGEQGTSDAFSRTSGCFVITSCATQSVVEQGGLCSCSKHVHLHIDAHKLARRR